MYPFLHIVFWVTFFLCLSTYCLYPMTILIISKLRPFRPNRQDIDPSVSIIITAFNEEKHIETKIQNTLSLDYPKNKLEIIVGSDGSTDGTNEIAGRYQDQGIRLLAFPVNRGKTAVQNDCVNAANGDILIFMDAASFLQKDALKKLVRNFADPHVGCVAGRLEFVNLRENLTTASQGFYWKYEVRIRELESSLGSLIGLDGPLYAIRKEDYVPLAANMISDFLSPLLILANGKKVVLEPEAPVLEDPTSSSMSEFRTRRRIALRAFVALAAHPRLLNVFKNPALAPQIIFHKLIRWLVGPLIVLNFFACLFLWSYPLFLVMLCMYLLFFMLAGLGFFVSRFGKGSGILMVPYYFTLVNAAASLGFVDFLRKKQAVSWQPSRA